MLQQAQASWTALIDPHVVKYDGADDYAAKNGGQQPPWNGNFQAKYWSDARYKGNALIKLVTDYYGKGQMPVGLVEDSPNHFAIGPDNKPVLDVFAIRQCDMAGVNIPPNSTITANTVIQAGQNAIQVPVPLRALDPGEDLIFSPMIGAIPILINVALYQASQQSYSGAFTAEDHDRLTAVWQACIRIEAALAAIQAELAAR